MDALTPQQFAARRRFRRDVNRQTDEARERWGMRMEGGATPEVWLAVATEEFGKLARCINKLHIAEDPEVRQQWANEGAHRLVTTASVLERWAAVWRADVGEARDG